MVIPLTHSPGCTINPANHIEETLAMSLNIITYQHPEFDLDTLKTLFKAYNNFLEIDLDFQNFDAELAALPGKYSPEHKGQLYLAYWHNEPVGCVGYYAFKPEICELKRLYVQPDKQGVGIGKALITTAIKDARKQQYSQMFLDSIERLASAQKLYEKLGFYKIPAYNYHPEPDAYHMALDLQPNLKTLTI